MAEEIVACPGCGKKFKIPEGAPGGTFQCTACSASVPYGKAAKGGAKAPAAKAAAPARAAAAAPAGRSASAGRRRGREEPEEEAETGRGGRGQSTKAKAKRDQAMVLWMGIGGILILGVGALVLHNRNSKKPAAPTVPAPTATQPATPEPTAAATPATAPAAGTPAPTNGGASATQKPEEASGIGGSKSAPSTPTAWNMSVPGEELFIVVADVPGVTPQEREALDKDVLLFVDRDSGKAGIDARRRLEKAARKAVPSLLSTFKPIWHGKKWEDDVEKFSTFQVQQLLSDIVKADKPARIGDFVARYDPRVPVPAKDFERAARLWTVWWNVAGKDIEKFKAFAD
jgi:hypothetical protein